MGSSSSIIDGYHIHISLSTKHNHNKSNFENIISKLQESGITITVTDSSLTLKETCNNIKNANIVIYCTTQNYGPCCTQAIEYSYLSENEKLTYNVIVDPYQNKLFSEHVQQYMDQKAHEISSVEDIEKVIQEVIIV